ncbi:hypothetical protein A2Z67_03925 [Candidatus Woesebacteria bacterium RBG_13_36_22]|uniref:DNA polymerase I n=1 Tax=Candidatus Woesebacteria bacterium RBG_13_36_22 TaxID=1802478 RepID=A0A1F7WZI3_9BACT|nr:MAG: hypothetical protein A2Z67_03925 [Candidatus Woesebacteria bacterium RBG_13_36_22]
MDINIVKENLKPLLEGQVPKVGQSIKWDYKVFGVHFGWYLGNIVFDTEIASSLLDERKGIHNLDRLTLDWLGERSYKFEAGHIGSYIPKVEDLCLRNCTDADNTLKIYKILKQKLVEADLYDYFMKMRAPAIPTIAKMEMNGLPVNKKYTQDLLDNYTEKIDALMIQINEFPEVKSIPHFNINSNPDLQTLFFDKLKFEHGRKTKTGYSTDKEVLDTLDKKYHHPLISMLQDYKETEKFANTYLDPVIKAHIKYDCRVHPTFTLHIASSGRLSCVDPNVQNVPARDEEKAREIKDCYEAPKGFKIGLGDYSQQELRILAQISQDPVMLEAFRKNEDLHKKTADEVSKVIGVQLSRAVGKGLNFGIVYGETEFGLSASLGVDKSVARSYIDGYLNVYQGVKEYQERQKGYLRQYGYVKTLFGRKRWIKLYGDGNEDDKKNAEAYRKAINTPIQGTGCDITILALILLTDIYEKEEFKSLIISNIHDALMFQMFEEEEDLRDLNVTVMENLPITFMKDVRLKVDWHEAKSWGKAKG